ncbi:hypothetical protein [Methylobacter sp.]|uniref:hypothetical protein n=1 Tax=Methylobacter sp. TaxID=2051955 RepID=UPI003DA3940A
MKKHILFGLMLVLVMMGVNVANAATFGPVTPSLESRDGPVNDPNDTAADLNDGNFFNLNDWSQIAKIDTNDTDNTYTDGPLGISDGVRQDGDLVSGNWSLDPSVWQSYKAITLVLNDGRASNDVFWSAWLLEPGSTFGHWEMNIIGTDDFRNLSHMTLYGSPVPVPAAVWLFGSGLLGLIGAARRKSTTA